MEQTKRPVAYVISLAGSEDRRAVMRARLEKVGLEYVFVDAIDCRNIDVASVPEYQRSKRLKYFGRDLLGGELGCFFSHKKVIDLIVDQDIDEALVLEDDAILADDFGSVLDSLLAVPDEYELVRFLSGSKLDKFKQKQTCDLGNGYSLRKLAATPGGAFTFLIKKSAALKLQPFLQEFYVPVDIVYGQAWKHKVKWRAVTPSVAQGDEEPLSTIGQRRFDKKLQISGMMKLMYPLNRFCQKMSEAYGKKKYFYFCD